MAREQEQYPGHQPVKQQLQQQQLEIPLSQLRNPNVVSAPPNNCESNLLLGQ